MLKYWRSPNANRLSLCRSNNRAKQESNRHDKIKKADRHKILSRGRIELVLKNTQSCDGDLYDKAVTLLKGLTEMPHSFDSANRRTAFLAAMSFLEINGQTSNVVPDARVLLGIRQHFYSDSEIREWLNGHAIRPFERR
jgi:prophage maintenance system killer protein